MKADRTERQKQIARQMSDAFHTQALDCAFVDGWPAPVTTSLMIDCGASILAQQLTRADAADYLDAAAATLRHEPNTPEWAESFSRAQEILQRALEQRGALDAHQRGITS